jgi:hypothetical protein
MLDTRLAFAISMQKVNDHIWWILRGFVMNTSFIIDPLVTTMRGRKRACLFPNWPKMVFIPLLVFELVPDSQSEYGPL